MSDQRPPKVSRWPNGPILVLAFAAYAALAAVLTYPLVLNLSSHLPKDLGDPLIVASVLWWNANVPPLTASWWDGLGFFPAQGMMAFSEHFLGASLLAAPLQWIGIDTIAAYNLTFLASFPLSAIAAHILVLTLTGRHDAAVICGLAFGFSPYRVAHVEHLELLLAFGMPIALTALHRYLETRRRRWLAVLAGALVLQALSSSYYALFFTVFFGLWIAWFMRPHAWRDILAVGAAGASAVLAVWPVVAGYSDVHARYNWRHDSEEVLTFSADLTSFITASPLSALWGWTAPMNGAERQLFPGVTVTALAIGGVLWVVRAPRLAARDHWIPVSRILVALAAVFIIIAVVARLYGPWQLDAGWLQISLTRPYKPFSVGVALAWLGGLCSAPFREALRTRSVFVFYLVAALLLFVVSLGPQPEVFGERVLYEPPYAWLMRLPFFADSVRVPARFAMLGILAMSVAAGLALHFVSRPRARVWVLAAAVVGIVLDGWIRPMELAAVSTSVYTIPERQRPAAVLELPLGDVWRDTAAVYRSTLHGVRVVNGYNGFEPAYYQVLRRGLADHDASILDALAVSGPILVAADNDSEDGARAGAFLAAHPGVTRLRNDGRWTLYWLAQQPPPASAARCADDAIANATASGALGDIALEALTDHDLGTRWIFETDEGKDDDVVLDLGSVHTPCGVELSMGDAAVYYPGSLDVSTSRDGVTWERGFAGRMAGAVLHAALQEPHDARITVPLPGRPARFVRLRADQAAMEPWAIADIVVR